MPGVLQSEIHWPRARGLLIQLPGKYRAIPFSFASYDPGPTYGMFTFMLTLPRSTSFALFSAYGAAVALDQNLDTNGGSFSFLPFEPEFTAQVKICWMVAIRLWLFKSEGKVLEQLKMRVTKLNQP